MAPEEDGLVDVICNLPRVHAVREPGTRGNAIFDLFRLDDNGKVLEHWDAVQPIPEPEKAMNKNGMF